MDSIGFRGGVATVKRLRINTIALCLCTGALTPLSTFAHTVFMNGLQYLLVATGQAKS